MSAALHLTEQLIAQASVTPSDGQCQQIIAQRLTAVGFECRSMPFGPDDWRVSNLWAKRTATTAADIAQYTAPLFVFAGHTDVVPTGPLDQWHSDPFVPTHRDGRLYGRGASDMKASLAAFVVASEEFFEARPDAWLSVGVLLTSDEEGPGRDGTVRVCEWLQSRGEQIDYCVVGEPTAVACTGDMIKNGRRGSLSGKLTVQGLQGHVAYPQQARSAVHLVAPALADLAALRWDDGNDARFMARICPQVVELGPTNASIHQIDEHIAVSDIATLKNIYRRILETLAENAPQRP